MNKYKATKVIYNGIKFDSKKEAARYKELKLLEDLGEISNLELQKKYLLIPSQRIQGKVVERECSYIADFVYYEDGILVVEDVKGYRDPASAAYKVFTIKRKLMLYKYGIRVKEI